MSEIASRTVRTRRKSRVPFGFTGESLVLGELKKRGFDARLDPRGRGMLVRERDTPPMRIHVKTARVTAWYVRRKCFVGPLAHQVTVFVLLGPASDPSAARFFVVKNRDLMLNVDRWRQWDDKHKSSISVAYAYVDYPSVKLWEDKWDILKS